MTSLQPVGFPATELARLSTCLARFVRHVRQDEIAITGGVAIQVGLANVGKAGSRRLIADLDFVASSLDVVHDHVTEEFLVSHYHVPQPEVPKFMIQLVDPDSRIRLDIFPDLRDSLTGALRFTIDSCSVKMLSLESVLDHKVQTVSKASDSWPIDPKHAQDMRELGVLFGREVPAVSERALVKDVYGGDPDRGCRRCQLSRTPRFPLAPKRKIFDLLGWGVSQLEIPRD